MGKNKDYTGIDSFRLVAAILIVMIHTSPLSSFSETGDFILTRVSARVAVPFFFMTSGFFLISRYSCNAESLIGFVRRTAVIYGISIVIYIPVNLYNGYFKSDYLLPNIVKDILFDGTLYHLWYLPAAMLGAVIAWYLVKRFDYKAAFEAGVLLYLVGLFGDSYYGLTEMFSGVKGFYGLLFQICDYTRNGIFFAPIFFILGGLIAESRRRESFLKSIIGFAVSFALMLAEAMTLRHFRMQRHDSMYAFLLPCMYFLFHILLHFEGKRVKSLRTAALIIYIIHPMMIVAIRLLAKLLHQEKLLVENSLAHFIAVCTAAVLSGLVLAVLWNGYRRRKTGYGSGIAEHVPGTDRAWAEIHFENLEHNVRALRRLLPAGCELMAVVKAECYGHGGYAIPVYLNQMGVRAFAAATIDEGIRLRKYGVRGEILILGYTSIWRAKELKKYDLTQTLIDFDYADALNRQKITVKAHIKIDTGMHRLGIDSGDFAKVKAVFDMGRIKVSGMYTHLGCAESRAPGDVAFTEEQIRRFYALAEALRQEGVTLPKLHIQSSYGLLNYPELTCDYVRAGIALYGVLSTPGADTLLKPDLRPVLSLKSRVVSVRSVKRGDSVGYDKCFTAERDSRIAILPVGYGDGFPRNLSCGRGSVLLHGRQVPVAGRVCMDQLAVDVTDLENVAVGDVATLIGADAETGLTAPIVAGRAGSISNELLCRLGRRLESVSTGVNQW